MKKLNEAGCGLRLVSLEDKMRLLKKIGAHAAEKLVSSPDDRVIALPDLYPMKSYDNTEFRHGNLSGLRELLNLRVADALKHLYKADPQLFMWRFYASALKHDLESLLLAAEPALTKYLRVGGRLGAWNNLVEDQNDDEPPKRIIEKIFRTKSPKRIAYRDTVHAPAILEQVENLDSLLHFENGRVRCPTFKDTVDWIVEQTGVTAY
jgi:hypothetical protein